jgi:hypothetical protein
MTIINEGNIFGRYISELKKTYKFDIVVFARYNKYFVYFEGLKNGGIVQIRYNIEDQIFEVFDYSNWLPIKQEKL